jgi:hypothetical protein
MISIGTAHCIRLVDSSFVLDLPYYRKSHLKTELFILYLADECETVSDLVDGRNIIEVVFHSFLPFFHELRTLRFSRVLATLARVLSRKRRNRQGM